MKSVLITGCNRGLGLELVRQLVSHEKSPDIIIATCRKLENAKDLQELSEKHKKIRILQFDVTQFSSYSSFAKTVAEIVGNEGLNVLINNAGICGEKNSSIGGLKAEEFAKIYETNTIAPIMLTQALVPVLKKAAESNATAPIGIGKASIINISSGLGSVSLNTFGAYYGYRESKAALNTATRSISYDLKSDGILVMALHPGWVQTDMGGKDADLTPEFSVKEIIKTLFSLSEKHHGAFLQYNGKELAW